MRSLAVSALMVSSCFAEIAYQSDWSGGPGVLGPVTGWGSDFSCETSMSWAEAPGLLGLSLGVQSDVEEGSSGLWAMDVDGDGDQDLIAACYGANKVVWWENVNPSGRRWVEHVIQSSFATPAGIVGGDFDGDGDPDVACASATTANVAWWANNGTGQSWIPHIVDNTLSGVTSLHQGDIDGDGDMDLTGAASSSSDVVWWKNAGGGVSWTRYTIDPSFEAAYDVWCADIDGDGVKDVVACGSGTWVKSVAWWHNSGTGTSWTEHTINLHYDGARSVTAADIDNDGDMDVAAVAMSADDVNWWANSGGTGLSWVQHDVDLDFDGASSITVTDIDGDGDKDILASAMTAGDVAWWGNLDGTGTSWDQNDLTLNLPQAVTTVNADVDNDGSTELIAGGNAGTQMWDLDDYQDDGALESSILDTQCYPDWGSALWSANVPSGTYVYFRFRASDNPAAMGDWSETATSPCPLGNFIEDGDRYFQYRARCMSYDPAVTPVINDVTFTWTPLSGVGEGPVPGSAEMLPIAPNPCSIAPAVEFGLPLPEVVDLQLFDISGRLVRTVADAEFQPGWHSVQLTGMGPGVYFVRMRAGEFEAVERFVMLE